MYRSSLILISMLTCCLLLSCDTTEQYGAFLVPESIEAGETVRITYDLTSAESKFRRTDSLYMTAIYFMPDGYSVARFADPAPGDGKASFTLDIPEDAVYTQFQVGLREQLVTIDDVTCIITRDGVPVRGALRYAIRSASSGEVAKELFDEDRRLYPGSLPRYVSLWTGFGKSGLGKHIRLEELPPAADCELEDGSPASTTGDVNAVRALGHFFREEYQEALRELVAIRVSGAAVRTLAGTEALLILWNEMHGIGVTCTLPDEQILYFTRNVLDIAGRGQCASPDLLWHILRVFRSPDSTLVAPGQMDAVVAQAIRVLDKSTEREMMQRMSLLNRTLEWLHARDRWRDVIRLYESKRGSFARAVRWCGPVEDPWVAVFPAYGIESGCMLHYGQALLRSGEHGRGENVLRSLIRRESGPDYQYAICEAINELAERAAGAVDTAEVLKLYARSADCACRPEKMQNLLARLNIDPKRIRAMSDVRPSSVRYRVPISGVKTKQGPRRLDAADGVYRLVLFTGASCSVCRKVFPGIMDAAQAWDDKLEIYYVDEKGETRGHELRGRERGMHIVLNYREFFSAFRVRALPEMRLILNGEVILEGVTNAQSFKAALSELKRR
jgi:hypothetical protein